MSRRTLDCFEACMLSMGEPLAQWETEYDDEENEDELDEDEKWIRETSRFEPEDECPNCDDQLQSLGKDQYCLSCDFDSGDDEWDC